MEIVPGRDGDNSIARDAELATAIRTIEACAGKASRHIAHSAVEPDARDARAAMFVILDVDCSCVGGPGRVVHGSVEVAGQETRSGTVEVHHIEFAVDVRALIVVIADISDEASVRGHGRLAVRALAAGERNGRAAVDRYTIDLALVLVSLPI